LAVSLLTAGKTLFLIVQFQIKPLNVSSLLVIGISKGVGRGFLKNVSIPWEIHVNEHFLELDINK